MNKSKDEKKSSTSMLPVGICIGVACGSAFGVLTDNLPVGLCLGLAIGAGLGVAMTAATSKKDCSEEPDDSP